MDIYERVSDMEDKVKALEAFMIDYVEYIETNYGLKRVNNDGN